MTTTTQPRAGNGTQEPDYGAMLSQVLAAPVNKRFKAIGDALTERIAKIEELLPPPMKGQAARLAKRAVLTLNRKPDDFARASPQSFVRCVLEAAELGLAVDGRLAHAVIYGTECTLQVDYKGLVVVARRTEQIRDCYARLVFPGDAFNAWEEDGRSHLAHKLDPTAPRSGDPLGAYAIVKLPGGGPDDWRYEWMTLEEINAIRNRSKSWKGGKSSPWKSDPGEMQKKTVIRRALKLYCDDPAFTRALEIDNEDFDEQAQEQAVNRVASLPVGRSNLRDLAPKPQPELAEGEIPPEAEAPVEAELREPETEPAQGDLLAVDPDVAADDFLQRVELAQDEADLNAIAAMVKAAKLGKAAKRVAEAIGERRRQIARA